MMYAAVSAGILYILSGIFVAWEIAHAPDVDEKTGRLVYPGEKSEK